MKLSDYIVKVVSEFATAQGNEITGTHDITFDIGINPHGKELKVEQHSRNRIEFTIQVKRS